MKANRLFYILFAAGIILLALSVVLGYSIDADVKRLGLTTYHEKQGLTGSVLFFSFALFFPAGIVLLSVAGLQLCQEQKSRVISAVIITFVLSIFMVSWPAIVGRQHVPGYFGIGGIIMIVLIVLTAWYWSQYRQRVSNEMRSAIDFKALGYFCFALAAWNTCGTLGLPGYGIYPDKMQVQFNHEFVTGQAKVVMLYFVLAWLFTFIGMRRAAKAAKQ